MRMYVPSAFWRRTMPPSIRLTNRAETRCCPVLSTQVRKPRSIVVFLAGAGGAGGAGGAAGFAAGASAGFSTAAGFGAGGTSGVRAGAGAAGFVAGVAGAAGFVAGIGANVGVFAGFASLGDGDVVGAAVGLPAGAEHASQPQEAFVRQGLHPPTTRVRQTLQPHDTRVRQTPHCFVAQDCLQHDCFTQHGFGQ